MLMIKHHWGEEAWSEHAALLPFPPNRSTRVLLESLPRCAWLLLGPALVYYVVVLPAILIHIADKH